MADKYEELVNEVIEIRKNKGLSQTELAHIVGCSQQAISRFERKTYEPTITTWVKILTALGYKFEIVKKKKG